MLELVPKLRVRGGDRSTTKDFETAIDAAEYLNGRVSSRWSIAKRLSQEVLVELLGERGKELQEVRLSSGDLSVVVSRNRGDSQEGVSVSADEENVISTVNIHGEPFDNYVFDRGMVWGHVDEGKFSVLQTSLLPEHGLQTLDLADRVDTIFANGVTFLNGVLELQTA